MAELTGWDVFWLGVDRVAGMAEGAAEGQKTEAEIANQRAEIARRALADLNQGNLSLYQQLIEAGKLEMAQRQFQLDAPTARAKQVVMGDVMANVQDVNATGLPEGVPDINFEGGLRPSLLGPNSRAFGAELSRQALLNQMPGGGGGVGTGLSTATAGPRGRRFLPADMAGDYTGNARQGGGFPSQRGNRGFPQGAGEIATARPEEVAGEQSPLVNTPPQTGGRVVPVGDVFNPLPTPPTIYGLGGTGGGGGGTAGPEGRLAGPGGRSTSPGAPASFGRSPGMPGYASPSGLESVGIAESGPGSGAPGWLGILGLLGIGGKAAQWGINRYMERPRNIQQTRPYYPQGPVEPGSPGWTSSDPNFLTPPMNDRPRQGPQTDQGFVWNIPQF
jgi:hypothetical protein